MTTPPDSLHELEETIQNRIPRRAQNGDILVERNTNDSAYVIADETGTMYDGGIGDVLNRRDQAEHELTTQLLPFSIQTKRLGNVSITPTTKLYHDTHEAYLSVNSVSVDSTGQLSITFTIPHEATPPFQSFTYDTQTLAHELEASTLQTPKEIDASLRDALGIDV